MLSFIIYFDLKNKAYAINELFLHRFPLLDIRLNYWIQDKLDILEYLEPHQENFNMQWKKVNVQVSMHSFSILNNKPELSLLAQTLNLLHLLLSSWLFSRVFSFIRELNWFNELRYLYGENIYLLFPFCFQLQSSFHHYLYQCKLNWNYLHHSLSIYIFSFLDPIGKCQLSLQQ